MGQRAEVMNQHGPVEVAVRTQLAKQPLAAILIQGFGDGSFQMRAEVPNQDPKIVIALLEAVLRQVKKDNNLDQLQAGTVIQAGIGG